MVSQFTTISKGRHLHESNEFKQTLNYSVVDVNETNDGVKSAAPAGLRRCKCRFGMNNGELEILLEKERDDIVIFK